MDKKYENLIFDVGNVLIDFCWKKTCAMLNFSEEIVAAFEKNMVLTDDWNMLDEGTITQEEAIQIFISRIPQYEKEIRLFWENANTFVEEYEYSHDLIKGLKEQGYKVYLLSNYPEEMYQLHWPNFQFFKLVDGFVVSALEKMRKPDIRIYQLMCERYHLEPESCLFFDDRMDNVEAARKAGMNGELFVGPETVEKSLGI